MERRGEESRGQPEEKIERNGIHITDCYFFQELERKQGTSEAVAW